MDKSRLKIETMFDEIAPKYDLLNHMFTLNIDKSWRKNIVTNIENLKISHQVILDLATGTGDLTMELVKLNPRELIASDISQNMLDMQAAKLHKNNIVSVKILQADALHLPFNDNHFDIITVGFGIRNFEDLSAGLKEMNRVLKKGGMLIILEMFKSTGVRTKIFNLYFGGIMPFFGNLISGSKNAYSYLFKSVSGFMNVNEFISLSEKNNFKKFKSENNMLDLVNTVYLEKL
ncbi:bifunctional demethylmenaquinone methyltransferase/2-methoxy-6-polyprenyl-1,4-benzoquinol methylase UbiE [soil metagenome]